MCSREACWVFMESLRERETERVDTRQKGVCVDAATGMCACAVLDGQLEVSGIEARRAVVG